MRLHVVALPHTQTDGTFTSCAYTEKVRKFCNMMYARGHEVLLYAGSRNTASCTEHITCVAEPERATAVGATFYTAFPFDREHSLWQAFNAAAVSALRDRVRPDDIICLSAGLAQQAVAAALPDALICEPFVGYEGVFTHHRVFESAAWMHYIYGKRGEDGRFYDDVIPNFFEPEQFPAGNGQGGYFLYLGRIIPRKGYHIAQQVCEAQGARLLLAGDGPQTGYGEFLGPVGAERRAALLGGATALFVPTLYIEPFGGVAVEAMLCGTPVISTDWGAFRETVPALAGDRCRTFAEFTHAARTVGALDRAAIREYATSKFTLEAVAPAFETYFNRLATLRGAGWYT